MHKCGAETGSMAAPRTARRRRTGAIGREPAATCRKPRVAGGETTDAFGLDARGAPVDVHGDPISAWASGSAAPDRRAAQSSRPTD
jgi:hypothetical protein